MKVCRATPFRVSNCPTLDTVGPRRALLFILALFTCPFIVRAQTAGSITTQALPINGSISAIDAAGNVYFTGSTGNGQVTAGAAQTQSGGGTCYTNAFPIGEVPTTCTDAYISKADSAGNMVFATLLGGPTADGASALAVDGAGNIFVTGSTGGSFPTTPNAAIPTSITSHVFAAKLSADGSRFLYSTYLPDTAAGANAIAIDAQGAAYIGGQSAAGHAYVLKLSPDGGTIVYNSYAEMAGSNPDASNRGLTLALLVDAAGNAIVGGWTNEADFPASPGVVQIHLAGVQSVFVAKLDSSGKLILSTYLGGSGSDNPMAVGADAAGNIYIAGNTTSPDFPTTPGAFQPARVVPLWSEGAPSGFVAKLSADFRTLGYSSYVMTADAFQGVGALAVTPAGEVYLAGNTGAGFPVTATAPQACFQGPVSVWVAHLDTHGALQDATYVGGNADFVTGLSTAPDGSIRVAWSSFSSPTSVVSQIRFGGAGWTAPACLSPTVLNVATMYGDDQGVAPGEFISLTGFGIGPDTGAVYQPDAQGMVPRELAGVQVLFDGEPAPVIYAQSRQVNAQAPFELSGKTVTSISLVYNGVTVGSMSVRANAGRPGIFRKYPGAATQAVAINLDGTVNGTSNPARRNSIVSVWGTGFPPLDRPCATGGLNPPGPANLAAEWVVVLGGGAQAVYAGSAPGQLCGVVQINVLLPLIAGTVDLRPQSDNPVTGQSGGASAIGATVAMK